MIKKICIITNGYPSVQRAVNTFVDVLVCQFAGMGIKCTVISPQSISKIMIRGHKMLPYYRERKTVEGKIISVYTPKYISASTYRKGFINTSTYTLMMFIRAAESVFKKLHNKNPFDALYGHFIFESGIAANHLGRKYEVPAFFAYGENNNYTIDYLGAEKTRVLLQGINGVISVSTHNKENLVRQHMVEENLIGVFPNSIDNNKFFKRDKIQMRRKYNLPLDSFIVIFVGRFITIKGIDRLSKAINRLGSERVKCIFIGSGEVKPLCEGILMQGSQPHDKVPEILSAADIFVLPTLAEGCCNAIIEAMACGLPIVSSNLPFNDDILDDTCSVRIDPSNIDEIENAIRELLLDKDLRRKLSDGALEKSKTLSIETRAKRIINFMESRL